MASAGPMPRKPATVMVAEEGDAGVLLSWACVLALRACLLRLGSLRALRGWAFALVQQLPQLLRAFESGEHEGGPGVLGLRLGVEAPEDDFVQRGGGRRADGNRHVLGY